MVADPTIVDGDEFEWTTKELRKLVETVTDDLDEMGDAVQAMKADPKRFRVWIIEGARQTDRQGQKHISFDRLYIGKKRQISDDSFFYSETVTFNLNELHEAVRVLSTDPEPFCEVEVMREKLIDRNLESD